ncbi:52 kDa repressor of the inhibitor of the protein kinase [Latimeria chalumnae]|uniref:THAP-type domain-containing protein n=1 Tax=Latimeria chalumnae TaxID=7897 RepID=H2ZUT2_LATCH|nr:PREDICTED: 52 kDa repressor of the inhibitor of the protein kinase isoform X1 [Latimeria chalumnae]|eukprot:XP_006014058.1 PREDICTED: 52 kDa repressor of the inhibitor of the protein kinase isoform X1 [Latimeria chalumnae]
MPNFCAAPNCTRKSTQSDLAFFRFPRDPERCKRWVENCRREDLENKTPDQLNKHYRLCSTHFEPTLICKRSPYRTVLKEDAVPTIFDLTSHLNNPQSRHRKRIKELTEEELIQLKKRTMVEVVSEDPSETNTQSTTPEEVEMQQEEESMLVSQEERENREYLRSLFEILTVMGKQNIPLDGHGAEATDGVFTPDNFQALLEFRMNAGDEVLRKQFEMTAVNLEYCSKVEQKQLLDVCESCIREETLREVRDSRFFSIVTEEEIDIAGEEHFPVFVRFVDDSKNLKEEFLGFLPCNTVADGKTLAVQLHTAITEKWGLNMEYCRGQTYVSSSRMAAKMKVVAASLLEKYPQATYTPYAACALNTLLAKSVPVTGIAFVLEIMEQIAMFFSHLPQLQTELDNAISLCFQSNEEKATELKKIFRSQWVERHDTFEIMVELLETLITSLDEIANCTTVRWSSRIKSQANMLSTMMTEFESVISLVVLKNALSFTRAFGKNLQGQTSDVFFAASSLMAVLHSLNEVLENIEVYHEFWFEEATNLASGMGIQVKLPGRCCRNQKDNMKSKLAVEAYYKEELSLPIVEHIIQELKDIFSENHLKALKCLSLVPSVMGQLKFNTSEENHADMYKHDLPNPDTLSAELHCWRIKWKHRGKDVELPSTIYDALRLSDIKYFPNVFTLLKVLCILPIIKVEDNKYETGRKRLKAYLRDTPREQRSSSLALLNINYDSKHDLDLMVDTYTKLYSDKDQVQEIVL